ncbi:M20 family metallo-hydrolase [Granulicella sp. WH15]|uniref:M20 family metallo-hydrolase n=1 Tax=Granulicella sp. WH15 TaxID=2602070 RepID=UPI001366A90F|nr:M20 family metallo-hydrolase [Granulicella sp. WH15]QHN04274.1 M20 family metallo-hydrolase [Granulicella sp. WH15]
MPDLHIDAARLQSELDHLATFTHAEPSPLGTAVTRVVFTPDDLAARAWLKRLATEAGLSIREDAIGNTFFRLEGTDPALAPVATGSHIDAIPHAGMYDGTVGVLGGLAALRAIAASGHRPRRSIETILLTSEEPTRFGIGCLGSRVLSGVLPPEQADALLDASDLPLHQVRTAAGFHGPLETVRIAPHHYYSFLELHIEQGALLERHAEQIGIVTSIAAPAGYRFVIEGFGGHAGALLMPDRHDALCAAAELVLSIERHALATGSIDTVATVGTCDVHPGAVNSVPSRVALQLDIRDTDPARRESVMHGIRADIASLQDRRRVEITESLVNADEPATCAPDIVSLLTDICSEHAIPARKMVSRAYHDTLFMARIAPVAMIFIPCRAGVSHKPDEFATTADIARGTLVLAEALARLAA